MLQNTEEKHRNIVIGAALLIVAVLIGVSFWSIRASNANVDEAVDTLSSFYMEELVGKREVVLRDTLNRDFEQLNRVISLMETENIRNQAELRRFLSEAQTLFAAQKLAVVDEDGTVYTAHSTVSDAARYAFLRNNFTEPQIITSNLYGAKKQVVVAVPVNNVRLGELQLVACFMQLDIDDVAGSLTYEDSGDAGNISIGLFYRNGENLTNSSFDDIGPEDNLLTLIRSAHLSERQNITEIEQSFRSGEKGLATIDVNGDTRYIYYTPVENTDWMLTVMVRDNTISDQLEYTSGAMMRRNTLQLLFTAGLIIVIFLTVSLQNRRNNAMRVRQQELEVKAKSEEELRVAYHAVESSRRELEQQLAVIGGLSNAFFAVYTVDLNTREYQAIKESPYVSRDVERNITIDAAMALFIPKGVHPDDREKMCAFVDCNTLADRLKDTDSIVMEYHSARLAVEWCRASWIVASRTADGSAERVLYATEDISATVQERKTYERELRSARDEAEKANKAKTDFLFNMSHDIRTPMNAIIGFTSIMEKELGEPEQMRVHLSKLRESSSYLLSIINNILDMARIESGKAELNIDVMDLLDKDGQVIDMFGEDLRKKDLHYSGKATVTHRYVYADAQKLRQIVVNLLSNAVKYTPAGGSISVQIDELPCDTPGYACYELAVSDTGIGMGAEFQEHIFESFSRERTTTENNVIGTGLGMAIVKKLIEMMNGSISVESELGKGSTFRVGLTLRIAESQEAYVQKQVAVETNVAVFEGKRILLAEDNDINAEIAIAILEDTGVRIDRAEDGVICVDMLVKAEPGYYDLILMDIQMPNMNGYTAAETIRSLSDPVKAGIPIIAMTANAFEEDRQNALKAGMNGHLAKPIDIAALMNALGAILK